jgi:hypothetical protein
LICSPWLGPFTIAAFSGLYELRGCKVTGFADGINGHFGSLKYIARQKYSGSTEKIVEVSDMPAFQERENIVIIGMSHTAELARV